MAIHVTQKILKALTLRDLYRLRKTLDVESKNVNDAQWKVQMMICAKEKKIYPETKVH